MRCASPAAEGSRSSPVTSAAVPGASRVDEVSPGRYVVQGQVDARLLADLTAWCAARDVMPEGLSVGRRSLEDVFLELTGSELRG